ncbi:MAG: aminoacyl-tRNA hydrolase [Chloroflexi bacterium]|nr:aminoacyl-tRNA hydrolase [Chloroflexota bacterium]
MDENLLIINERLSIPAAELQFRFSTSSGPGGQHVNRSETRVTLLFDVAQSPSLDDATRARLLTRLAQRLDKDGVLPIHVQDTRSQHQNREIAIGRLQLLLADALKEPKRRRVTKPHRAAVEKRLAEKKQRSQVKKERGQQWE